MNRTFYIELCYALWVYDFSNTISAVVPDSRIFLAILVQSFPFTDFSELKDLGWLFSADYN